MSKAASPSKEDLKYLQTWARESRGPDPHDYQPIENENLFGDSPICAVCRQAEALCAHDQNSSSIPRIVLAVISEIRRLRRNKK